MTGGGNWTYALPGATPALIDAGVGDAAHLDAVAAALPDGPRHVIVTHAHGDHASGAPAIRARWPQAQFFKVPWPERDARYVVDWRPLADDMRLVAGNGELEVLHTPGHAPDHIALWEPVTRTLFCGDLVQKDGRVVILASSGGSLTAYLASLARVHALGAARFLPAHGSVIDDPGTLVRDYIDHRLARERQVRAALAAGARTVDDIAARIYVDLAPALVPMAHESVLAHLIKLEDEGVATRTGDEWRLY